MSSRPRWWGLKLRLFALVDLVDALLLLIFADKQPFSWGWGLKVRAWEIQRRWKAEQEKRNA